MFDYIEHNYLADSINSNNSKTQKVLKKTEIKTFVNWLEQVNLVPIDRSNESLTIEKFISKKPKLKH